MMITPHPTITMTENTISPNIRAITVIPTRSSTILVAVSHVNLRLDNSGNQRDCHAGKNAAKSKSQRSRSERKNDEKNQTKLSASGKVAIYPSIIYEIPPAMMNPTGNIML